MMIQNVCRVQMMRKVMRVVMQPGVRMRTPVSIPNLQETRKMVYYITSLTCNVSYGPTVQSI
ncbi:hypothetical protein RchiOBHm_Chr6g0305371 [Rosa chinensis]|uniref:Uncharacterized protein n=1 Tax=Rosa chinensis TaxID=74649 RepID=A0A2P6PZT9_ROSCH|nr:hypothetical protein RchiOBHm_Chr6g0305371 [Rosa chinensis]